MMHKTMNLRVVVPTWVAEFPSCAPSPAPEDPDALTKTQRCLCSRSAWSISMPWALVA